MNSHGRRKLRRLRDREAMARQEAYEEWSYRKVVYQLFTKTNWHGDPAARNKRCMELMAKAKD